MARLDPKPFPVPPLTGPGVDLDKAFAEHDAIFARLREASLALPEGEVVGALLTFPVGDGKACYRVTKAKPLTLQHVPVVDAYQIPGAHVKGITLRDVKASLASDRRFSVPPIRFPAAQD